MNLCRPPAQLRCLAQNFPRNRALSSARPRPNPQVAKSKGPKVPESVLKKRKRQDKWDAEKKAAGVAAGKKAEEKKAEAFKRAEAYVKEFRDQEQQITTMKRAARKLGTFYVEPEPKLLFVMRLRGINGMHPKTRHIMKVLRLLQIHNGVFVQANKAVMNNLVKVDPYTNIIFQFLAQSINCSIFSRIQNSNEEDTSSCTGTKLGEKRNKN